MKLLRKIRALFRQEKLDAEMAEEMRVHLELQTRANLARGMSLEDAHAAARRSFGGVEQIKERAREQRGLVWIEQGLQDVRFAVRSLRRNPGFALVAVLMLGLGIGANTAVFSVMNALTLRSLPVADPAGLLRVRSARGETFSYPTYKRFRDQARAMEGLALIQWGTDKRALVAIGFGGSAVEPVKTNAVSGNYFKVLGVGAALGRALTSDDDRPNAAEAVAVLSHAYWTSRYGADPAVLGKTLQVDGVVLTIVGVMPEGFAGFEPSARPDLWCPVELASRFTVFPGSPDRLTSDGLKWALIIGRLNAATAREVAAAELQAIFQQERAEQAAKSTQWSDKERREFLALAIEVLPAGNGFNRFRKELTRPLGVVTAVVGLVLLVACANLAGLLLARGAARRREFAVRAALGAARSRIVRQLVTESLLLALLGGAVGVLFALGGVAFLRQYLVSQAGGLDVSLDGRMLVFATGISIAAGLIFGLVPAWRLSRGTLHMTEKAAAGAGPRLDQALVVAQIAVSIVLLSAAGLFVRSLQNLKSTDLGFQTENRLRFELEFSRGDTDAQRASVHKRLLDALQALPQVRSATLSGAGLLGGDEYSRNVAVEGEASNSGEELRALVVVAGPRFFETMGIPLRAGRDFAASDETAGRPRPRIAVVGESFARRFFGTTNPLGRRLKLGSGSAPPLEIIGVAKDLKYRTPRDEPEMQVYVPYFGGVMNLSMTVNVAVRGDPGTLAPIIRSLVRDADPRAMLSGLRSMDEVVDATVTQERMVAQLSGFFGVFALTLASLGLYGVLSYGVVRRTREIGVRMALGALPRDVLALVVGQGMKLSLLGAAAGVGAALVTTQSIAKLLYGVTPGDPATFLGAGGLLMLVTLFACWLPARRAAKVDPMVALRCE